MTSLRVLILVNYISLNLGGGIYIPALLIIAKSWKKINRRTDKQIIVYSYDEILLSNKGNKLLLYTMWMNLKNIMLSKRSRKSRYYVISFL